MSPNGCCCRAGVICETCSDRRWEARFQARYGAAMRAYYEPRSPFSSRVSPETGPYPHGRRVPPRRAMDTGERWGL